MHSQMKITERSCFRYTGNDVGKNIQGNLHNLFHHLIKFLWRERRNGQTL